MCGLAGIINFSNTIDFQLIKTMTDIIAYRGPDDFGYLGYNTSLKASFPFKNQHGLENKYNLFFGHRRLSIIDLSQCGHQPMSYKNGRYWIVFNGEIYNYLEIRQQLIASGHEFLSNSDTEVVMAAYDQWGSDCLTRFNGMWAFALLDTEKNELFLARDYFGIKPLYYYQKDGYFSFSSEIKQLLELPFVERRVHHGAAFDFLVFNKTDHAAQTLFEGIRQVPAASFMKIGFNSSAPTFKITKWWDIDLQKEISGKSDAEYAERFFSLLEDSIRLRLRSDVPVGTSLSGGLDSSAIACIIDKIRKMENNPFPYKTFTAASDYPAYDESNYAKMITGSLNVDPHFVTPTPAKLLDDLDRLIWHQEVPFISTSIFASWCVFELARQNNVTVLLDGQGADEMLAGYHPDTAIPYYSDLLSRFRLKTLFESFFMNKKYHRIPVQSQLNLTIKRIIRESLNISPDLSPGLRPIKERLNVDFWNSGVKTSPWILSQARDHRDRHSSRLRSNSYNLFFSGSLNSILRQVDRNSMAFSVEARVPFLDHRLVEYTFALPDEQKLKNQWTKWVLRNSMKNILPEQIRTRINKFGFITAEPEWLKGAARDVVLETLASVNDNANEYFRGNALTSYFARFNSGDKISQVPIWTSFCFLRWMAAFKK